MQIGIRREEQNPGTALTHGLFSLWTFVGREVVHDDNVTGLEGGSELGLDIGLEDASVHRCVDDKGRGQPIAPQSGDEGLSLPVPKRGLGEAVGPSGSGRAGVSYWSWFRSHPGRPDDG